MTAWMLSGWAGVLLVVAALQVATRGDNPKAVCEADLTPFVTEARARRGESQAARDSLLDRLGRLDRRHRAHATDCAAQLWQQRAILETTGRRYDSVVGVVTRFLASPVGARVPDVTARMYSLRGNALYMLGETAEANEDIFRSAALAHRVGAPAAAVSLSQAAESAALYGDWDGADAYLRRARAILLDSLPARPGLELRLGRLAASEAGLLSRRLRAETDTARQQALALRLLSVADTAVAVLERTASPDPVQGVYDQGDHALALSDGAHAAAVLGRVGDARVRLSRATRGLTPDVLDLYPGAGMDIWQNQWTVEALSGDLDAAARVAHHARDEAAALNDVEMEALAVEALALFDETAGHASRAETLYLEAMRLRDVQWQRNRLQDWSAASFAAAQVPYRGLARVYVRAGRAAEAFAVLDGSRARALRDLRSELERRDRLTPAVRAAADSLLEKIQALRLEGLRGTQDVPERSAATAQLSELQRDLAALTASERDEADRHLDHDALRAALSRENRTLVSYLVGERESVAFVVTPDTLVARTLPVGSERLRRWMEAAGSPWSGGPDPAVRLAPLHRLHESLVRPLADLIPRGTSLVFIPDGPLADLPFGMLVEAPAETYADAAFLIRRRPVSVELAAALVAAPASEERAGDQLVAFGRSRFGTVPAAWREGRRGSLPDLPHVAREIARIGERVGRTRLALDADATESRLGNALNRASVVHLASHAQADPVFPALSRIFLWDDPDDDDDGVLHLYELQARRLHADLIVLSGCSTAGGQAQLGEGTLSLQYGVRAAGAQAALATLWPVDDRAMAEMMDHFYTALAAGLPKDRALQRAQIAYLDGHEGLDASPFYWASLVLSGSVAPIDLKAPTRTRWSLLVLGGLLLAAGLAWRFTRRRHVHDPD